MGAQHRGRWDLLRLARSSAAGQGVLVLLDGLDPLHGLESLEHGVAVQVIDLVLQAHTEQVARGLVANQVGIQVVRLDDDMVGRSISQLMPGMDRQPSLNGTRWSLCSTITGLISTYGS